MRIASYTCISQYRCGMPNVGMCATLLGHTFVHGYARQVCRTWVVTGFFSAADMAALSGFAASHFREHFPTKRKFEALRAMVGEECKAHSICMNLSCWLSSESCGRRSSRRNAKSQLFVVSFRHGSMSPIARTWTLICQLCVSVKGGSMLAEWICSFSAELETLHLSSSVGDSVS